MNYAFAERVQNLKPSAIREILKYSSDPAVIPFSAGNPAPEAFPVEAVQEITARILSEHPIDALQYSLTEGYPALRERLSAYMKEKHNVGREGDVLLVTSGAQQVMGLAVKALCNKGDVVLCEAPSFIGSPQRLPLHERPAGRRADGERRHGYERPGGRAENQRER